MDSNRVHAVQVIADSERAGTEVVFEKESDNKPEPKQLNISPIESAAFCGTMADYYGFGSRRTIGRVMRAYLDEYGLSALELVFDAAHLMMLERDDKLCLAAIQRVAQLQAKQGKTNPVDRADAIYQALEEMIARAKDTDDADRLAGVIEVQGLEAAIGDCAMSVGPAERPLMMRFALARYLGGAADWNAKFQVLAKLGAPGLSQQAIEILDEALAELADAASAMMELLGGQRDLGSANRTIALLAVGRCPTPKNPLSCIEAVNDAMGAYELPLTKRMSFERLASEVGGTKPLTREGRDVDRDLFVNLIRDLVELAGLEGGAVVAEGIVRRARIVLSGGEEDLSFEGAVARILDLLPHRAVRMGFLLDLVVSPLGQENQGVVFAMLGRLVQQMTSIASFLPKGATPETRAATIGSLKHRLTSEGLPKAWRDGIAQALDGIASDAHSSSAPAEPYSLDEETKRIIAMTPDQESFKTDEVLFFEGEQGETAYLIKSGEVEILHTIGNEERILARLGRGEIFGEMSLIDNQPRMATARISQDAELAVISRENIQSRLGRLQASDTVLRRLIDVFVTRIRGEARTYE